MLPVVVIGADDSVQEAFEQWNDDETAIYFFGTTEDAAAGLIDVAASAQQLGLSSMIPPDDDGRWECTVVYGPGTFGFAASGQDVQLAHTGWTVLAASNITNTQHQPRRVAAGRVQGEDADTMIWEAMARLSPNFIADVAVAKGDQSLATLRELLAMRETP